MEQLTSRRLAAAVALVVAVTVAPAAFAYSVSLVDGDTGPVVRWPTKNLTYYYHPDCSTDLPTSACLSEVHASFDTWEGQACSGISFTDMGPSTNKSITPIGGQTNGKNEVAWIENSAWYFGTYTLGVTSPVFYNDGTIIEADIAMNGYQQTWSMSGANFTTDVRNVLVHEIGHFFGLQHVLSGYDPNDPPTMAPTADPYMGSQTPEADDFKGLCFLVPATSFSCSSTSDCPLVVADGPSGEYYVGQIQCGSGLCGGVSNELPDGDKAIGEPCVADGDCASPLFCQPLQTGSGVCAQECQTASPNCPSGFDCVPYSNAPGYGVCLEGSGGGGGQDKGVGEPCDTSAECESFLCVTEAGGGVCRQPCFNSGQCPSGQDCMPLTGVNYGACFPSEGDPVDPPTGLANGEPCEDSQECQSSLCVGTGSGGQCVQPCGGSSQCKSGELCFGLQGGGGACLPVGDGQTGDGCDSVTDCANGICASFDGGSSGTCSETCNSTADCPCGMECYDGGSQSLCGPGDKVGCVPDGQPCTADSQCVTGTCTDNLCGDGGSTGPTTCSVLSPTTCEAGEGCLRDGPGSVNGTCYAAGPNSNGKPCGQDNACQSLLCVDYVCSQPCNPNAPSCGAGQLCQPLSSQLGACVDDGGSTVPDQGPDTGGEEDTGGGTPDAGPSEDTGGGTPDAGPVPDTTGGEDAAVNQDDVQTVTGAEIFGNPGGGGRRSTGCSGGGDGVPSLPWLGVALLALLAIRRRR